MAENSLPDPDQLEPSDAARTVLVPFSGGWLERIDTLKKHLAGSKSDEEAVATAVATLSKYAGKPLFVEIDGEMRIIEHLWKPR